MYTSQRMSIAFPRKSWIALSGVLLAGLLCALPLSAAGEGCAPVNTRTDFGPYDYRTAPPDKLARVENYHFGPGVESLTKGNSTVYFGGDLAFVLRYFPNHHRALATLVRLAKKEKTNRPQRTLTTVECYFELASRFAPNDGTVNLLHGLWLMDSGNMKGAQEQLGRARELAPEGNANYQYNLGLGLLAVGKSEEALEAAHIAYGMSYPLPGLRQKLEKAGKWRPLPPAPATPPSVAPTAVNASQPKIEGEAVPAEDRR